MLNNHIISAPNPKGLDPFSLTTVIYAIRLGQNLRVVGNINRPIWLELRWFKLARMCCYHSICEEDAK